MALAVVLLGTSSLGVAHFVDLEPDPSPPAPGGPRTFHLSSRGDDASDGLSPDRAWRSLERVNAVGLAPGDRLLMEGGSRFRGTISIDPGEAGDAARPVVVGSYGTGRAIVEAAGGPGITVHNTAGVEIRDLTVVGDRVAYARASGINIYSDRSDGGKLDHIEITGVEVTGFKNGIQVAAGRGDTGFRKVRVRDSLLRDNRENGLITLGPTFDAAAPRYAHEDVVVSGVEASETAGDPANRFNHTGSGIVFGSVANGRIERSSAHDNGAASNAPEGPVGIWAYDSTAVIIEHNVSYRNRTAGRQDGGGFDLDQNVSSSVLQYNLSYDNDGAGYLLFSGQSNRAHTGNVVRFNISNNDSRKLALYGGIVLSGSISDIAVYHNTVVTKANGTVRAPALRLVKYRQGLSGVTVRNNILQTDGMPPVSADAFASSQVLLQGNDLFDAAGSWAVVWGGATYRGPASWRAATGQERLAEHATGLSADPRFATATARTGAWSRADAFVPAPGSPVVGTALDLKARLGVDPGPVDFFGRALRGPATVGAAQPVAGS